MTDVRRNLLPRTALTALAILTVLTLSSPGQAAPPGMVANPQYDSWAPFGLGASSTLTMIDRSASGALISDSTQTQTVTALDADSLTLATQATAHVGGQDHPSAVLKLPVPATVPEAGPSPAGTRTDTVVAPGAQSITVPAGTFQCTRTTVTTTVRANGQTFTTVMNKWTSDQVPGSVVKIVSESSRPTGDTVMTYELIEFVLGEVPVPPVMEPNPEYATWASFSAGATATYSEVTLDGAGVPVGQAIGEWTLHAVSDESVTVSNAFTTRPGTPDEFTCSSGEVVIPAMVPVNSGAGNPAATTTTVVAPAPETVDVPAGTFACRLKTTTTTVPMPGGQVCTIVAKAWTNDTVPGALVKSTSVLNAGTGTITTVMQLTAFHAP